MEYIKIKNAEDIIKKSNYLFTNTKNFKNKWKDFIAKGDPYYNINLRDDTAQYEIKNYKVTK